MPVDAPPPDPVSAALAELLERAASFGGGRVADYIPELATADPDHLAVAAVSVLGRRYHAGDAEVAFTVQSISKPFVYALVVAELGLDVVAARIGFEPSGEPFNAISLEPGTGRPANPMINAGAIAATALVPGADATDRFERIVATLSSFAGRPLEVDERVFRSEMETGDRNRALAHLMRAAGALDADVDEATEAYFRQCAVLVTTVDLAVMGATLANAGTNPVTGEHVVPELVARHTLSLMATCGMYDHSGEWMVRVGLPAKSGVGGGILAALPAQFGIGVFGPRLDEQGNSTRGVVVLEGLSSEYDLHVLDHPSTPRSPVDTTSADDDGTTVVVLRGELDVIAVEQVVHHLDGLVAAGRVRLDLDDVTRVRPAAVRLLAATVDRLAERGTTLVVHDPAGVATDDGADLGR